MDKRSELYDKFYAEASAILERDKPCEVECNSCLNSRVPYPDGVVYTKEPFCCQGCQYLGAKGCTVQALSCRVWLCYAAQDKYPDTYRDLQRVRANAEQVLNVHNLCFRGSKEDHLKETNRRVPMSRG